MKYSNLTYSEKIIKWFESNPKIINSICEDGCHILDWIYDGYTGKVSAKVDLTILLLSKHASLNLIKVDTYKKILQTFLSTSFQHHEGTKFVLQFLLEERKHLNEAKNDPHFFNPLILNDTFWDSSYCNIKNQILYSKVIVPFCSDKEHEYKVNIYSHPINFLLEQYFFYLHEFRNYDTYTFLKIDKIHELNENIFLENMYVDGNEKMLENLNHFSINKEHNIIQILDKIKKIKESKINNLNNPLMLSTIEAIDKIIHRDFYRGLQRDLFTKEAKENKFKV